MSTHSVVRDREQRPKKRVTWSSLIDLQSSKDTYEEDFGRRRSLYGPVLQELCMQTQHNLARLASFRGQCRKVCIPIEMPYQQMRNSNVTLKDQQNEEFSQDEKKEPEAVGPYISLKPKDAIKYMQQSTRFDSVFSCDDERTEKPEALIINPEDGPTWFRKRLGASQACEAYRNPDPQHKMEGEKDRRDPTKYIKGMIYTLCYFCSTMEEHRRHIKTKKPIPKLETPKRRYVAPRPKVRINSAPPKLQLKFNRENLYKVTVCTGDVIGAGTTADVSIALEGTKDYLPLRRLKKSSNSVKFVFQRNSRESFYLRGPFLGEMKSILVELSGTEEIHNWFLDSVSVCDVFKQQNWLFRCAQWLSNKPGKRRLRLKQSSNRQEMDTIREEYRITVETGKCRMAGTNANVSITLYGSEGNSDKLLLANQYQKCFGRGSIDTFLVYSNQKLGRLKRIRIEHDNEGFGAGWFLNKVVIVANDPNKKSTSTTSGKTKRNLNRKYTKSNRKFEILSDISDVSDEEEIHESVFSKTKTKENLKKVSVPKTFIQYIFMCQQWLATDEGDRKTSKILQVTDIKYFSE